MKHWLVKQEPETYPFAQFVSDGRTDWTGVRNFAARNHLRAMGTGDAVLYYHTGGEKAVVGIATVSREAFPDPTVEPGERGDWSAVELRAGKALARPVPLAEIRLDPRLDKLPFLRQSRLSVSPVGGEEYNHIVRLGSRPA